MGYAVNDTAELFLATVVLVAVLAVDTKVHLHMLRQRIKVLERIIQGRAR